MKRQRKSVHNFGGLKCGTWKRLREYIIKKSTEKWWRHDRRKK